MLDPKFLTDMFHVEIPLLEKILRPVIVYLFLVAALRLGGKRELAQLNPFDLVVLLTLSNTVQNAIIGADNSLLGGLVGATTLLVMNYAVVRFLYKHKEIDRVLEGEPEVVIEGGRVKEETLKRELITIAELEAAARKQGFGRLDEIERAVIDPGGTISFVGAQPEPGGARFSELIQRLDQIVGDVSEMRRRLLPGGSS
jgi:uncharacterized membrane protein YcaP (DUF421 family)